MGRRLTLIVAPHKTNWRYELSQYYPVGLEYR